MLKELPRTKEFKYIWKAVKKFDIDARHQINFDAKSL